MIVEVESDNVHTTSAVNGKSSRDNSPNVDGAGERSIAVRNVRKVLGYFTDIGVSLLLNSTHYFKIMESNGAGVKYLA